MKNFKNYDDYLNESNDSEKVNSQLKEIDLKIKSTNDFWAKSVYVMCKNYLDMYLRIINNSDSINILNKGHKKILDVSIKKHEDENKVNKDLGIANKYYETILTDFK